MKVKMQRFGAINNNCYLIIDEDTNKSALVDCSEDNQKMYDLIGDTDLQYILLTHGHFDHIIGAKGIKQKYNAKVVISAPDEPMLSSGKLSLASFMDAKQNNVESDIIVFDSDVIRLGNIEIKVLSTPGHTKGSVCYLAENALFSGDTLFRLSCGRTDFPSGSVDEMMMSLKKLKNLDGDYTVYTGHDEITSLDFERNNNPYMSKL
ncbi:MAG TPA: hypothetical protein DCZ02_01975 [Ruminococcaceae bacterium]|nr:hypothetical protein [Oscillospiraceae bacterium]